MHSVAGAQWAAPAQACAHAPERIRPAPTQIEPGGQSASVGMRFAVAVRRMRGVPQKNLRPHWPEHVHAHRWAAAANRCACRSRARRQAPATSTPARAPDCDGGSPNCSTAHITELHLRHRLDAEGAGRVPKETLKKLAVPHLLDDTRVRGIVHAPGIEWSRAPATPRRSASLCGAPSSQVFLPLVASPLGMSTMFCTSAAACQHCRRAGTSSPGTRTARAPCRRWRAPCRA